MDKLYLTNNISESLHSKINFYLPKYTTSSQNFSESMIKVFLDDSIKIESIKRYDIKSRAIISIIEDLNLNTEAKWVKYETFKNYEFKLLKDNYKENSDLEINSLYKEINYDLDDKEEKNISNNNNKNIIMQDDKKENEDDLDVDEIDINNEENEIKEEDVNDNEENNEECILNYNNFNLYKDITNNINNLNLNNEDSYIDVKVNEKNLDNRNSNNNIIDITSLKPNKRKKDCDCNEYGIECIHIKEDSDNFKVKKNINIQKNKNKLYESWFIIKLIYLLNLYFINQINY